MTATFSKHSFHCLLAPLLLLTIGLLQTASKFLGEDALLRKLAYATAASPMPEVFGAIRGHEPMTLSFNLEIENGAGERRMVAINQREIAAKLQFEPAYVNRFGPYFLSIIWGPQFAPEVRTSLLSHGLCNSGPLARLFGLDSEIKRLWFHYGPRSGESENGKFEVDCSFRNGERK